MITALDSKISDINNMLFFKLVGLVAQLTINFRILGKRNKVIKVNV